MMQYPSLQGRVFSGQGQSFVIPEQILDIHRASLDHPHGWCYPTLMNSNANSDDSHAGARDAVIARKFTDSEKITINLGFVDLGHIDLLVSESFYSNRTDFIRTAIRNQLNSHSDVLKQVVSRKMLVLGLQHFSLADLLALQAAHQRLNIRVLGLVTIAQDVSPELALATIESLDVLGALHASAAVKAALASRLR